MANKKFSEFTLKTDSANVDFLVGYDGTDNVRIAPDNLGGGGASSLNDLSDVLIDTNSEYVGTVPAGLSGNPQNNTTLGISAGLDLTTGNENTLIGTLAGSSLTTQNDNVVIGNKALRDSTHTSNRDNIIIGSEAAGFSSGLISRAVIIGRSACDSVSSFPNGAVAIGYRAARSMNSGSESVFIGNNAASASTGSSYNTVAIGSTALQLGFSQGSVIVGKGAQSGTGNANNTVSIGYQAQANISAAGGISIGYQAGYSQTSGASNTNVGYQAGYSNTTGTNRTCIGYEAGENNTGSNNVFLGYQAAASSATVSNEITLGNSSISALRCQVQTISALSDSRDKTNIQPSPYGLDLISQLQPVTFDWNMRDGAKVGQKDLGFIAQELQEVDDENLQLVYDSNPDRLEASYGRLIPVLVQAIKELKAEVELLKNK